MIKNNESMEMYLETIYLIAQKGIKVHSIDVATEMGYSKPSISRAMRILEKNGYIVFHQDGEIELTKAGYARASDVYLKHTVLTNFFVSLGANKEVAEDNACKIEHIITDDLFALIKEKVQNDNSDETKGN